MFPPFERGIGGAAVGAAWIPAEVVGMRFGRLGCVGLAVVLTTALTASAQAQGPVVPTDKGAVRGLRDGDVDKFLGVRYAAPPVGARRWAPPAPAAPWSGVRNATAYGDRCAQLPSGNGPRSESEDCLYLNVYRPAGLRPDRRAPVLFWIHGGGLRFGAGDQHDGSLLASTNDIVVVSVNYRLGVFGFLALPSLGGESDGNYGLLDQQAALRWVNRNIASFGGDPGRVTIAGESAGAFSTCANLVSPAVRGLFWGAILQSGGCVSSSLADSEAAGAAFAEGAGCPDPAGAATCLRSKPAAVLLDAGEGFVSRITSGGPELPGAPADAVAAGSYPRVPVLMGTNLDEGRFFAQTLGLATAGRQDYEAFVGSLFGPDAPAVLAEYPFDAFPPPYQGGYAIGAVITDGTEEVGSCSAKDLVASFASRTPSYFYEFADRGAPGLNDDVPGFDWGAAHTLELPYMWPSFHFGIPVYPRLTPAQLRLSGEMLRYWGAFVRFRAPVVPGQAVWVPHQAGRLMSLRPGGASTLISAQEYAAEHNCSFWDSLGTG
jgi:carboxylesterase type B